MTVVHIGYKYGLNDTGGAAIASTRVHLALLANGIDSHYVTVKQCEAGQNVHVLPQGGWRRIYFALAKVLRCCWKFTPYRESIALNVVPMFGLEKVLGRLKPDVIHVQWINADVMSFGQLKRLRDLFPKARFVFNLHDLFMINIRLPYPGRDRRYQDGVTRSNTTILEHWLYSRKREAIDFVRWGGPIAFVGPSNWVATCCRHSLIGRGIAAYAVPNLIGAAFDHVSCGHVARRDGRYRILFGAYGGRGERKGFGELSEALALLPKELKERTELVIFGENAAACETGGVSTRFLGSLKTSEELIAAYCAADVLAFPSKMETQGMTKVEALLCGCPVVAFDRTACAEGIDHGESGWVAEDGDIAGFAAGLAHFAKEEYRTAEFRERVAESARKKFSSKIILERLLAVYRAEDEKVEGGD